MKQLRKLLSLALALTLCLGLAVPAFAADTPHFTDVPAGQFYTDAVTWAVEQGITNGTSATTFSPNADCSQAQILAFLWRSAGRPGAASRDMSWSDELAVITSWAQKLGITSNNFSAVCTRATAMTYMWKAAGSPTPKNTFAFNDVSASADYAKAVSWAVEQGIANGTGAGKFSPDSGCNRGQIMTFLYRQMVEPIAPGQDVSAGKIYSTDPEVSLNLTDCDYLRARSSETSYSFDVVNVTISSDWTAAHGKNSTITWSVDDPSVLSTKELLTLGIPFFLIFYGEKAGDAKITCRVTGEDGYVSEAYCYVTVIPADADIPAPTLSEPIPTFPASDSTADQFAAEVVRLVNIEREKEGLNPLGTFQRLTDAANIRAPELAVRFSHTRPDGSYYTTAVQEAGYFGAQAENAAVGQATPAQVVAEWMNSPGHRDSILNPTFTHIGVGYYYTPNGAYKHHWIQIFVSTNIAPFDTTSWTGPEPELGKPVYDGDGRLTSTDSQIEITSATAGTFCTARMNVSNDWIRLHGVGGYRLAWRVDDPSGILEINEAYSLGLQDGTQDPTHFNFRASAPGEVKLTCTVVGMDGYVSEAYCYITFASR